MYYLYIQLPLTSSIISTNNNQFSMQPPTIIQLLLRLDQEPAQLPLTRSEIESWLNKVEADPTLHVDEAARQEVLRFNLEHVQKKFILMMQEVFKSIESQLKHYHKNGSINYLDPLILKALDPKIYHKGYQLHKHKSTPMTQLLQDREIDDANKLFTQIFDVMNQLLTTMRIYYGYDKQEQLSQALYESIAQFAEQHEDCVMVEVDRRSFVEQEEREKEKEKTGKDNQAAPYDILLDVLDAIGQDKTNLSSKSAVGIFSKAQNLLSVVYKYAIAPTVGYTYDKIKNINPLATNKKLTAEEQLNLRMSLYDYLRPNLSIRDPLDEKMVTLLIKMVPMKLEQIVTLLNEAEKAEFLQIVTEVLNDFENPNGAFEKIVKQLMKLLELVSRAKQDQKSDHFIEFKQAKWIIIFYKAFEPNYSPERRRVIYKVCHIHKIKKNLINPIGILKLIESENENESQLLGKLRKLQVSKKDEGKKKSEVNKQIQKEVEHQLHRIHLFELKNRHQKTPLLEFDRLTSCSPKRVISLLFSGFMSEDTCKLEEWGGLIDTIYDSEIYSVRWESKSYGSVFDFAVETAKDIAEANMKIGILGSIGGPYLRAIAIIRQIYKKYHNNPFNPAYKSALKTGEYLAELIIKNFKGHFINLVGFSLGTELIKNVLLRLAEKNCLFMVNKVYFMGGLTDKSEVEEILKKSPVPLTVINLYSHKDSVLKYLLKLCKPSIQPIGLNDLPQVPGHNVRNRDCSVVIDGHLAYRDHMNLIAKLLNMKDD